MSKNDEKAVPPAKPGSPRRAVFQAPPKPGGNFPGKGGPGGNKGGPKSPSPKGRIFRHQGR